jgi:hypothetical protein
MSHCSCRGRGNATLLGAMTENCNGMTEEETHGWQ